MGFMIPQNIFDPHLCITFAKGQRRGQRDFLAGGKLQKGLCIFPADIRIHLLHNAFVTGHFHIPATERECRPHQGIKPMKGKHDKSGGPKKWIQMANMGFFVQQDILLFRFV